MNRRASGDDTPSIYSLADPNHLVRQRVNALFSGASKKPVMAVCAGAGCGKTLAVSDFLRQEKRAYCWIKFSEHDNNTAHFWKSFTTADMQYDIPRAKKFRELGFPDTDEKKDLFSKQNNSSLMNRPGVLVWDDFHLVNEPAVLLFAQKIINEIPPGSTIILIYRDLPNVNIETLQIKDYISEIRETDLDFNETELAEYLRKQKLNLDSQTIREIYEDTKGWAFAVNLAVRSLKKVPNYFGYVKSTLKQNIYKLMEVENWSGISEKLKHFLVMLSLIDHLSVDLVNILAEGDDDLLSELKRQTAYIRLDNYGGAYLIHHLFLDFLRTRQGILTSGERNKTYKAAASWCSQNNFKTDALNYYEKIGDYEAIVAVIFQLPLIIPHDIALCIKAIFDRAPMKIFNSVMHFAVIHMYVTASLGDVKQCYALGEHYERKFLALPKSNAMRNTTLSGIYFCLGLVHAAHSYDDYYDFDKYFAKMFDCLTEKTVGAISPNDYPRGPWINMTYSCGAGSPQKYIEAVIRSEKTMARFSNGITLGSDFLIQGEFLFYQGNTQAAEPFIIRAIENSTHRAAYDTLHRALFYLMRIAVTEGNMKKAKTALRDMENLLGEKRYYQRFTSYDIAFGWLQYILRQPDMFPRWLTEEFSPYFHASSTENFGNQIKARYCYLTRNYPHLLSHIGESRQRKSYLYGRVEMLAMEACAHYQMKNKTAAWAAFREAYETAAPNDIVMPFVELGKDMRTLAASALRKQAEASASDIGIPRPWLESIRHKATAYAKNQSKFITENKQHGSNTKVLSAREQDVLSDLYHGFSQSEIAGKRSLSINTVKMVTKSIYDKLHVHKISDLIRIASEKGLV
jgi:LuxR family maltose regulon positive regulatory protein